ncbi:hypothetical protein P1X16_03910 [Hymenobacter sp. YC55]|nr:hypothetical protein [Hymenobacter sp. YC55]
MTPQSWLQSEQDYDTGRLLYEALGTNPMLKRTLSTGPNRYNRAALAYELGKLAKAGVGAPLVLSVPVVSSPNATKTLQKPVEEPEKGADLLATLKSDVQPAYDHRRYLHAQLPLVDEPTRLTYALNIQRLSRSINEHWKTVAYVKEHGHLPVPEPTPAAFDVKNGTLAELIDARNNLRSNISKWKKKPARAADLARAQAEVLELTARIDELKGKEVARG